MDYAFEAPYKSNTTSDSASYFLINTKHFLWLQNCQYYSPQSTKLQRAKSAFRNCCERYAYRELGM